jgi:hypothetical protein
MAFVPQNFVDQKGPVISAAFLNGLDQLTNGVFQSATTNAAAISALFSTGPLPIALGGTGATNAVAALNDLGGITPAQVAALIASAAGIPITQAESNALIPVGAINIAFGPGNLFRYGAVGGSTAADTQAWLYAVAQANQFANGAAPVYVPTVIAGFSINAMATATRPIRIIGNGYLNSILNAQSNISLLTLDNVAGSAKSCLIDGIGMTGVYTGATGFGITFVGSHDSIINNCRITGFGIGVVFASGASSYCCKILNSRIEGNISRNLLANANTNALTLFSSAFGSSGSNLSPIGIQYVDGNNLWITDCDIEGLRPTAVTSTVVGIDLDATSVFVGGHKIDCHFENNANTVGEVRIGQTSQIQGVSLLGTILANTASGAYGLNLVNVDGLVWLASGCFNNFNTANINYGTVTNSLILPCDGNLTLGQATLGNGPVALPEATSAQTLTNGSTILTVGAATIRLTMGGGVNSIKVQQGTIAGQMCVLINETSATVGFDVAGNSNVADGATAVIPAFCARVLTWDSGTSLWYRAA